MKMILLQDHFSKLPKIKCVKPHLLQAGVSFEIHAKSSNVIFIHLIKCQSTT